MEMISLVLTIIGLLWAVLNPPPWLWRRVQRGAAHLRKTLAARTKPAPAEPLGTAAFQPAAFQGGAFQSSGPTFVNTLNSEMQLREYARTYQQNVRRASGE
jgi:hypothetical protein